MRDLGREGFAFMKMIGCDQDEDLFDTGVWNDDGDPLQSNGAKWWLWLHVELGDGRSRALAHVPWPLDMRRDDFDAFANEVARVFAHHHLRDPTQFPTRCVCRP